MKKSTKEWAEALMEAGVVLLLLFVFFWPLKVEGISMENTFYDGDRVSVSRAAIWLNLYGKGDIVGFTIKEDDNEKQLVKRLIAEGGDSVRIADGQVFVNDTLILEDYITGSTQGEIRLIVPKGQYFVLGDNREHSMDSRHFGMISEKVIFGKVIMKWYPFEGFKIY